MIFPGRAERSPQLWFAGGFGGPRRYALILPGETLDKRESMGSLKRCHWTIVRIGALLERYRCIAACASASWPAQAKSAALRGTAIGTGVKS
jgi:hypothetical protein